MMDQRINSSTELILWAIICVITVSGTAYICTIYHMVHYKNKSVTVKKIVLTENLEKGLLATVAYVLMNPQHHVANNAP